MRNEYDFSHARRNPYAAKLKQPSTTRLDAKAVAHFKGLAAASGVPYQTLIDSFLRDWAVAEVLFHWDPREDAENQRQHRVSFEEAHAVFADERALLIDDPEHSTIEDRFVLLGLCVRISGLLVVRSYREDAAGIRIIAARRASNQERRRYD